MSNQVTCIKKTNRTSRHERIHSLGGINASGGSWINLEDEVIAMIESGRYHFFTEGGGQRANVIVATHQGHKYLKTDSDTTTKDNLLSLPECP